MTISDVYSGARFPGLPARRARVVSRMPRELDTSRYPDGPGTEPQQRADDDGARSPSEPPSLSAAKSRPASSAAVKSRAASAAGGASATGKPPDPDAKLLEDVREFLPAVDRIVKEHGKLLPKWDLPVSQLEYNTAAREYRRIFARRALESAERLRRKAEAGEPLSDRDFSQGIVTRETWEAWLARKRAEEAADRKIPPASPEPGTEESSP